MNLYRSRRVFALRIGPMHFHATRRYVMFVLTSRLLVSFHLGRSRLSLNVEVL